jgi:hypothetical protein
VSYEVCAPLPPWPSDPLRAPFVGARASRRLTLRLHLGAIPPLGGSARYGRNRLWAVRPSPAGFVVTIKGPNRMGTPARAAIVTRDWRRGDLYVRDDRHHPGAGRDPLEFPLDVVLFPAALAHAGGAVVHAAGVVRDARAFVFAGPSGAGKSTIARILDAAGCTVLGDERIVLRGHATGVRAYGTPWPGDLGQARASSAPLAALFFLEHGTATRAGPIGPAEAARRLLPRCRLPVWDVRGLGRLLAAIETIVACTPCLRLPFVPDLSVLAALDRV